MALEVSAVQKGRCILVHLRFKPGIGIRAKSDLGRTWVHVLPGDDRRCHFIQPRLRQLLFREVFRMLLPRGVEVPGAPLHPRAVPVGPDALSVVIATMPPILDVLPHHERLPLCLMFVLMRTVAEELLSGVKSVQPVISPARSVVLTLCDV